MLGFYKNFPQHVHKIVRLSTSISNRKLQQTIIQTLHKINNESFNLNEVAKPSIPQCTSIFEFGIAEAESFNYLDHEEVEKVLESLRRKPLQIIDFFCAIRYYKVKGEKNTPLKFDYYMLRFIFDEDFVEVQIFHERGPRHVIPEDIINLVIKKINESFSKKALRAI
ncbi:MAG: hypothetical protein RMJ15_03280 [Nitrososphaerota archaeon]|nr:hypothetical protein [Candidatus Bathyarchaeota archaeon]MDW8022750.1 hypothetical protein [Nitrososphaerota archaeon]